MENNPGHYFSKHPVYQFSGTKYRSGQYKYGKKLNATLENIGVFR
jgi:hypothetical protein